MKYLFVFFISFFVWISSFDTLDIETYVHSIQELTENETFQNDYSQWSLKLFSQSDYLYGPTSKRFPCSIGSNEKRAQPTSVHQLRPENIQCIAAIGDSLATGLASHALTIYDVLFEKIGMSWAMGGDYSYSLVASIPNILRQYNSNLTGYLTTKSLLSTNSSNASIYGLNAAFSDTRTFDLPYQTAVLLERFHSDESCHWSDDWKLINILIGHSDLCHFCHESNQSLSSPEQYIKSIRDALDLIYHSPLPRTLINLIPNFDIRQIREISRENRVCPIFQKKICPCIDQTEIIDDYLSKYRQGLFDLIKSNRYDDREDFTVVLQPFLIRAKISPNDWSLFAPDCFHWSGKGHRQMALSLWNNMFEPVGHKRMSWFADETIKCSTDEYPFIFTSKNSIQALNDFKSSTRKIFTTTTTTTTTTTGENLPSINSTTTTTPIQRREEKESLTTRSNVYLLFAVGMIIVGLVLLFLTRRKTVRVLMSSKKQRHFKRFADGPDDEDEENDEVEVWSHPNLKVGVSSSKDIPKTHGSRIDFE